MHTFTGSLPRVTPSRTGEVAAEQTTAAEASALSSDLPPSTSVLTLEREADTRSASASATPTQWPDATPGPATGGIGITWRPLDPIAPATPKPSTPTAERVSPPLPLAHASVEVPARPIDEAPAEIALERNAAPVPPAQKPHKRIQHWDVVVGTLVVLLCSYLLLAGMRYAYRLWQARQSNSVVLVQNIGHGGDSQITVTFTSDDWLMVSEIDNDDPTRVTVLAVTQVIALANDKVVLEAWLQTILQPGRLDLVMQLDGGLDWLPYRPLFTTILVNNVAAVQKNPHAPGLRAPTAAELQQALRALGT